MLDAYPATPAYDGCSARPPTPARWRCTSVRLVWDMTMPFGAPFAGYDTVLPRFAAAGVGAITLTVQNLPGADLKTAVTYVANRPRRDRPARGRRRAGAGAAAPGRHAA